MGRSVNGDELVTSGVHYLRREGRPYLPVGAHFVPVEGPDWPWRVGADAFDRAFEAMASIGLDAVRIDLLWAAIEPHPGRYDDAHLRVLDEVVEAARRRGVLLHPTLFIGGEVGDAFWDVPWRNGRHPHADPELRASQAEQARALARRWRADPAILAWDLTDEPPFWPFAATTTDDDARAWTAAIADALRAEDPGHLITIGTSSQEVGVGPFRADVVADRLDFACVHPYPIYQEDLYPDALLSPRMTLAGAFETALAAGAGKPVMVHEYGASSAQFDPDGIAAYDRLLSWSSLGRGSTGFFAWCWADAEPAAYARAPYVRQPHETQFGVTDHTGSIRPRGRVLADLAATTRRLDLDGLAAEGPAPADAVVVVPHEYVRPYDSSTFGLESGSAGPYEPAERAWSPGRDHRPLVRGWLNAFVLAARAGLTVAFPRERPDGVWPDAPVVLLPAPLTSTGNSLLHVRTRFWSGADAFAARGGVLYLSCSADSAIPELERIAGCRLADRANAGRAPLLRFVARWGPLEPGDELELPAAGDAFDLHTRGARLSIGDAQVVAVDAFDEPALVVARRGSGHVVTCSLPVELLLAGRPDAHGSGDRSWAIYAGVGRLAGIEPEVRHPDVVSGRLVGPRGGILTLTNHGGSPIALDLTLREGASNPRLVGPNGEGALDPSSPGLELEPHAAAVVGFDGTAGA